MKKTISILTFVLLIIGSNVFAADGDLIFNGNVGIGTGANTPAGKLDVEGAGNVILNAGNVGIGKTDPAIKLDVNGEIRPNNSNSSCTAANEGAMRYNSTNKVIEVCTGSEYWYRVGTTSCAPDSYTKLLLHMDGTNGSTTFTDSSSGAKTVTKVGNSQITTANKVFGTGSGLFDGSGDYLTVPDNADWYFAAAPFTIDFWVKASDLTAHQGFCGQWASTSNYWAFYGYRSGAVNEIIYTFKVVSGGTTKALYTVNINPSGLGTFNHIELVRNGANIYIFINGVSRTLTATTPISTNEVPDVASTLYVGGCGLTSATQYVMKGWLDEFRISKGIARHTSNFTPPPSPYCN